MRSVHAKNQQKARDIEIILKGEDPLNERKECKSQTNNSESGLKTNENENVFFFISLSLERC